MIGNTHINPGTVLLKIKIKQCHFSTCFLQLYMVIFKVVSNQARIIKIVTTIYKYIF